MDYQQDEDDSNFEQMLEGGQEWGQESDEGEHQQRNQLNDDFDGGFGLDRQDVGEDESCGSIGEDGDNIVIGAALSDQINMVNDSMDDDQYGVQGEINQSEYEDEEEQEEVKGGGEDDEKAINLIVFDQQRGFYVSEEAQTLLRGVKEKIGVIAVAGKYRTGKSFLLNRIILNKTEESGFGVGPTINPCTKGLWIWNKPIEVERQSGEPPFKVFIIDSEGIGAFNEDQNHDTRIFLLALLLSSYFVYNSMGTIDENALQNLSLIIKNSKAEDADPDEVSQYFPSFMWVVRDFSLRLLDQYGNQINSKEFIIQYQSQKLSNSFSNEYLENPSQPIKMN